MEEKYKHDIRTCDRGKKANCADSCRELKEAVARLGHHFRQVCLVHLPVLSPRVRGRFFVQV